jgi:hypothetical protein
MERDQFPDLRATVVAERPESPSPNQAVSVDITVENIGGALARKSKLLVTENGSYIGQHVMPVMAPGDSHTVTVQLPAGTASYLVEIDYHDEVDETDETNNSRTHVVDSAYPEGCGPKCVDGYWTDEEWRGYAWGLANGGDFTPASFSDSGDELCAFGTLQGNWSDFAFIGLNVNQERSGEVDEWDARGFGLYVASFGADRVQIENADGERWCAPVPAGGTGQIPWTEFKTACWDDTGDLYDRSPLTGAALIVAGQAEERPYATCLIDIYPYPPELPRYGRERAEAAPPAILPW